MTNQKRFFEWFSSESGFTSLDDWYKADRAEVCKSGAFGLINSYYQHSLSLALSAVFPDHLWVPWRFRHVRYKFWEDSNNVHRYMEWLGSELGVERVEEWAWVRTCQVDKKSLMIKY